MRISGSIVGVSVLLLAAQAALAQQAAPPSRIDNIYNGAKHEPDAGSVRSREQSTGIAPPQSTVNQQNREVESQAHLLEQRAQGGGPQGATPLK